MDHNVADLQSYATQQANQYGIPASLFLWQIGQESGWNPNAQNGNASGIAQFMPATAAQYGVNVNDPYSSIAGAAQYDAALFGKTGNWQSALTSYGTLANVPSSVMSQFNQIMNNIGLPTGSTANGSSASQSPGQVATSDGFITKVATIVLAIVIIGGAIFLLGAQKIFGKG